MKIDGRGRNALIKVHSTRIFFLYPKEQYSMVIKNGQSSGSETMQDMRKKNELLQYDTETTLVY